MSDINGFGKLITDMINDLLSVFPELDNDSLDSDIRLSITNDVESISRLNDYCNKVYPERFFDILYENEDVFKEDSEKNVCFLPGIDFRPIWNSTNDENRKIIWKYLKLILFSIVSGISDQNSFGDTNNLFEAIDKDELKKKLEDTIKKMSEMMGGDKDSTSDESDKPSNPEFDAEGMHSHLEGLMGGKLGSLAKEIAAETTKDMGEIFGDVGENPEEVFKTLLKDPTNIMKLVKSVGSKLDERIKKGDINESELMEDAKDMMNKMKDMPGMGDIGGLLSKMGIDPSKLDMNAMAAHMEREMKKNATKERMRKKMNENNKSNGMYKDETPSTEESHKSVDELADWIESSGKNKVFKVDGGAERSVKGDKPNKKKKKKKDKK